MAQAASGPLWGAAAQQCMAASLQSLWELADCVLGPEAVLGIIKHELHNVLGPDSDARKGHGRGVPTRGQRRSHAWRERNFTVKSSKRARGAAARPNEASP
jgi:hypothetical protein